jgi:subtilisin family serine protease
MARFDPSRRQTSMTAILRIALTFVLAALPGLASAATVKARHRDGELLVRFKESASARAVDRAHADRRARVARRFGTVPNLDLVTLPDGLSVEAALVAYRRDPAVAYAEPNYTVEAAAVPDDPLLPDMWNMSQIEATAAWDLTTGSPDVVVAVPDSGIEYTHPDLAANVFRNEIDCDADGVDDDQNGFVDDCFGIDASNDDSDPLDDNGHGTLVSGVIGAVGNNGVGVVGVNWQVKILACKMIASNGSGALSDALECLDYIAAMKGRGVNIVAANASWVTSEFSQALLDAIETLTQLGVLFVAAAGNSSTDVGSCPAYPAGFDTPGIVSVAATDDLDELWETSSFGGGTVHLAAPGGYHSPFGGILTTALNGDYDTRQGTSLAAPHVTGVAALLKAQDPFRDWTAIRNLLLTGGDPLPTLAGTTISGHRLNARGSLDCQSSELVAGLHPAGPALVATEGMPFTTRLAALHLRCGDPAGDVTVVRQPGNESITLRDDGTGPDRVAGDGLYATAWTATLHRTSTLTFPDGDGETVHVQPQLPNLFTSPTPSVEDSFGHSVAMSPTHLFIGAPGNARGLTAFCHFGSVYVFDRETRALVNTFVPPIQPTSIGPDVIAGKFGASIAVDGGRLLVGAPFGPSSCHGCQIGQALVFDAVTGDLLHILNAPRFTSEPGSVFLNDAGTSVAMAGNTIVVGAPRSRTNLSLPPDPATTYYGAAIIFDAETGAHRATLLPPSTALAEFGQVVATTPTRAAVSEAGRVHVFDVDPNSPGFGQLLITYDGQDYGASDFGHAIAFVGDRLVVGAPATWDLFGSRGNGAVFVFDGPTLVRTWVNPLSVDDDRSLVSVFGASLAPMGENTVVIGAPEANTDGRGSAYVFDLDADTPSKAVHALPSLTGGDFGAIVGALDDQIVVAAPDGFEGSGLGVAFTFSPTGGFPTPEESTSIPVTSFSLRDDHVPPVVLGHRSIRFKASTRTASSAQRIVPPAPSSDGDPTVHDAVLTVYNAAGLTLDAVTVPLPATGATLGDGWKRLGTSSNPGGYVYKGRSPTGAISRVLIKRDLILVRGGKDSWGYTLDEPAQGAVAVRLQLGDAPPWCAVIPASAPQQDRVDMFVGRRDAPAPAGCPSLP